MIGLAGLSDSHNKFRLVRNYLGQIIVEHVGIKEKWKTMELKINKVCLSNESE